MRYSKGFTILELMATMALIGVLTAIAYPSYVAQISKGRRAEAVAALLKAALKEEKYFSDHGAYTSNMTQLGFNADPATTEHGFYQFDAAVPNGGQSFVLTATRLGVQMTDTECGDLTYSSLSIRSAQNASATDPATKCWSRN